MSKEQGKAYALAPRAGFIGRVIVGAVVALVCFGSLPAAARHWHAPARKAAGPAPVFEWIVLDADTGQVMGEQNADVLTYPASLTKMMTLYLTFEALNQGRISLDQRFYVSPHAASQEPTKLGLRAGDSVTVRNLILGIVTKSANDAAAVLAEGLAGSEQNFARYMTAKARQLGMEHTWYDNASGLPDPGNRTTARDVARLALALYHQFPREYRYFSTREFDFRGEVVHGHNHLLDWYPGADGIKTGFINASGFNLATSAVRNGRRLIGVIMGGRTARIRDMQMASLLDQGFARLAGRPAQPAAATAVAAAAPAPAAPATAPAVPQAPVQVAAGPAPAAAKATAQEEAAPHRRPDSIGDVARSALRHLAPVAKAEAAPLAHEAREASDDWAIQIGAFRAERVAENAARHVVRLAILKGKPPQVVAPTRAERTPLYRVRLLHFTEKTARTACVELHRRGVACSIVRPAALKVATR